MTTLTVPNSQDAELRLVPWHRMAWVTWRQHRFALGGLAVLLGGIAIYLWLTGLSMHQAYATAAACPPATSDACQNQIINFNMAYGATAQTVGTLLLAVPMLIGGFIGAPVLARELETGTFRYAWTLGVGRRRWTIAKLLPLAAIVTGAAALLSLVFSWYYQPLFTDGNSIPLDPSLFGLRGVAYAAWTLAAFSIGAFIGLLVRRVVPAIAATLAVCFGLMLTTTLYLRSHYEAPLVVKNLINPPAGSWILNGWWTHGAAVLSNSAMNQIMNPLFQQVFSSSLPKNVKNDNIKFYKGNAVDQVTNYLQQHGYAQWTSYQPGSRFWPFQWIEGGWLLVLSVLLIAATIWLVHRRAA